MSIRVKDPIDGVVRLIEEQVTKNAVDVNDLKYKDMSIDDRIQRLESGANLGGGNLVRFSFSSDGETYYELNNFVFVKPANWEPGDFIELSGTTKKDIPAYGEINNNDQLELYFKGDYTVDYNFLIAVNITKGDEIHIQTLSYTSFYGTMLGELVAQDRKSQIVNILTDVRRGGIPSQYVSFDLNGDGKWNWVYIGSYSTGGGDGNSLFAVLNTSEYTITKSLVNLNDIILISGDGIEDFSIGDLRKVVSVTPFNTILSGNIRGPQGEVGPTGLTGLQALTYNSVITKNMEPSDLTVNIINFMRAPVVDDIATIPWFNIENNRSYLTVFKVTAITSNNVSLKYIAKVETTGLRGLTGEPGEPGLSFRVMPGVYTTSNLPSFSTTTEGEGYIVLDTSGPMNSYVLYYNGVGSTDWTIIDNWSGVPGPAPVINITSTPLSPGSESYATLTTNTAGNYTINLFLAAGPEPSMDILNTKVDKVTGKGLSTNDYDDTEKTKLANIESGAEVNILDGVKVNGVALPISVDKMVDVTKDTLGLGNVNDTSDASKPVSIAQATAINEKYTKPSTGIPKTHLETAAQTSLGKADTALQSYTETDPTVPSHVKSITANNISAWNAKSDFSGNYNDLTNKPTIPSIPAVMTTTEGTTGTATTQRTVNAANLKATILAHSPAGARPASDVSSWAKAASRPTYTYAEITKKPTTIAGYGITDTYTKTEVNSAIQAAIQNTWNGEY